MHLNNENMNDHLKQSMLFSNKYPDEDYKENTQIFLNKFLSPKLKQITNIYEIINSVFIIKPAGWGVFDYHQDWNMVDETIQRTYGIWIPLQDVNHKNGTVTILPGSHNYYPLTYRSATIPWIYDDSEIKDLIKENQEVLNLKAGEAVIFDNAIIHSTTENETADNRAAIFFGIKPYDMQLIHFYGHSDSGKIECFETTRSFFHEYDYISKPAGKSLGFVGKNPEKLSVDIFKEKLELFTRKKS
jgi:hypothetical protein